MCYRYDCQAMLRPAVANVEWELIPPYYSNLYPWFGSFKESHWETDEGFGAGVLLMIDRISESSLQKEIACTYAMIDDGVGRMLRVLSGNGFKEYIGRCTHFRSWGISWRPRYHP